MVTIDVVMITYNHEDYIEKAIRSVMMQETSYEIRLLIGEDCSTDSNRTVIESLCSEFGDKITPYYRQENMGSRLNLLDLLSKCKGDYIAFLEGDDYWTVDYKIEKMVGYMETHTECYATYNSHRLIDSDGNVLVDSESYYKDNNFQVDQVNYFLLPGQTSSLVLRYNNGFTNTMIEFIDSYSFGYCTTLDRLFPVYALSKGRIYCFEEVMSVYRLTSTGWTARNKNFKLKYMEIFVYHQIEKFGKKVGVPVLSKEMELMAYAKYRNIFNKKRTVKNFVTMISILPFMKHPLYVLKRTLIDGVKYE